MFLLSYQDRLCLINSAKQCPEVIVSGIVTKLRIIGDDHISGMIILMFDSQTSKRLGTFPSRSGYHAGIGMDPAHLLYLPKARVNKRLDSGATDEKGLSGCAVALLIEAKGRDLIS